MSELKPISAIDAVKFLREATRYFERRPTDGEDSAFWANVRNAETCTRIAEMLERTFRVGPAPFDLPSPPHPDVIGLRSDGRPNADTNTAGPARQKGERV